MFRTHEFLAEARVETVVLEAWISAGWLMPRRHAHEPHFSEADLARARLINDLKHEIGVNDEGVGVILDLLDQIHGLRRTVRDLARAVPPGLHATILADLRRDDEPSDR